MSELINPDCTGRLGQLYEAIFASVIMYLPNLLQKYDEKYVVAASVFVIDHRGSEFKARMDL